MTDELNTSVLALWEEQKAFLTQAPIFAAQFETEITAQLAALHAQAEQDGNQTAMWAIVAAHERVQEFKALFDSQQMTANNAGIIIGALKVQRDEIATQLKALLQQLGYQDGQETPLNALIERLYESWLDTLDTDDIESDAQDNLLDCIYEEIEGTWNVPAGLPTMRILSAIRGHLQLDRSQAALFQAFLDSMG